MKKLNKAWLLFLVLGTSSCVVHADDKVYTVTHHIPLGEPGKWDYTDIDTVRNRLFVSRGDRVLVVDLATEKKIGEIANTQGVHGIAFAQDLKLGFTSNGRSNTVTVFDLDTLKIKQELKVSGSNPDAILYEPNSHKLLTFNGKTSNVTVIDAASLKVVAAITASGRPEFAVSDNAGKIFFNIEDKSEMNVIDVASNSIVAKWSLSGCEEPTGLAMDIQHNRLFSVCQNKRMVVTDASTGKRVADVVIGEHPDAAIYDAETATIYSSNGDGGGSLSIVHQIDADHYEPKASVITAPHAKTMAMDKKTKTIYLPAVVDKKFVALVVDVK